jgi:hypothetical protein
VISINKGIAVCPNGFRTTKRGLRGMVDAYAWLGTWDDELMMP